MKEIFRRLFSHPVVAAEILAATLLTTLFNLAMPLYVMQILNRYVSYGFHGTLITLTLGMVIAIFLQFCFKLLRNQLAVAVNQAPNDRLSQELLTLISQAKAEPLSQISKPKIQEALTHVQTLQQSYDSQTLLSLLDAPFSLVLIFVIYLLSPMLAALTLLGIGVAILLGWLTIQRSKKTGDQLAGVMSEHRGLNFTAVNGLETVRAFGAAPYLQKKWQEQLVRMAELKTKLAGFKEFSQTMTMSGSALTSVLVYAAGAVLVVQGQLSVGALIGVNILFGRAYQSSTRLVQALFALDRAREAMAQLAPFRQMPIDPVSGTMLKQYGGKLQFQDLGFAYPNAATPVFESLNLTLEPGTVLGIAGDNGTGKTTLAKILVCLLDPRRGNILADGVNLRQMAPAWWRRQVMYMPQEPGFISGTLRENILMLNPKLEDGDLNRILRQADLRAFLDQTPQGLDTPMTDNERNFPPGIRKRISLARALASEGALAVLDEPTDGLDKKGVEAVYQTLNLLAQAQKTIVVCTNDPNILKGAALILNLNIKPVPQLAMNPGATAGTRLS